jgi:hypothetical protein
MITWPRVRIIFALIGMISTAIFLWDQIGIGLQWALAAAEWLKSLVA